MNFTVTKNGKPLDEKFYTWDENSRTLSTTQNDLVLDFSKTGPECTFDTGSNCTFKTGYDCTFKTGSYCTFNTRSDCTFDTCDDCTFDTGSGCTFDTCSSCTFKTGPGCTFNVSYSCTFDISYSCVIVRRDVFEVIQPEKGKIIKINERNKLGFSFLSDIKITVNGKDVILSNETIENIKKQIIGE